MSKYAIVVKGNVVKVGTTIKRVPKDKTCVISGFEFDKNGNTLRKGSISFIDRIDCMVVIKNNSFGC